MSDPIAPNDDPVARAKAIALKLAGNPVPVAAQDTTVGVAPKRKRWSTAAEPVADDGGEGLDNAEKRAKTLANLLGSEALAGAAKTSRKIWIPVDTNPGYNYVGLLIGPGGSKQKSLQAEAGGRVKIAIRGRGSSGSHNSSLTAEQRENEEPLHVLLEGDLDCVDTAEKLVRELIEDTNKANEEKARQLSSLQGGGMDPSAVMSGGAPSYYGNAAAAAGSPANKMVSTYTPTPVAQLLGLGAAPQIPSTSPLVEETMGIPNGVVGYVIGKGGESITSMQRRTQCRVQIQKENEMAPGTATRIITLSAANKESIAQCRAIIEGMVAERLKLNAMQQGGGAVNQQSGTEKVAAALASGQQLVTVQVPDADVGLVIGKGGMNIRSMQDRTGANIQIPQQADIGNPTVRTISITHPTIDGATLAKSLVEEILRSKANHTYNHHSLAGITHEPGSVSVDVPIPDKDVGMIIGRSGCVIREMQTKTRTRIQIPSQPTPGHLNRIATVSGNAQGCEQVKQMIERMVMEQSSQSVMTGANFTNNFSYNQGAGAGGQQGAMMQQQGQYGQQAQQSSYYGAGAGAGAVGQQQQAYGQQAQYGQQQSSYYGAVAGQQQQQQQQQQAYGQQASTAGAQKTDYSAEWAAYYAAQAAAQGGSATAAPSGAPAPAAAAATSAPTANGAGASDGTQTAQPTDPTAYYNDFWRYAAYYGEEAARKYYGAWSPPAGTPNPNPTDASGQQQQAVADNGGNAGVGARDSSARKVSNLPAWMTKS